jgi:hypothetical protein
MMVLKWILKKWDGGHGLDRFGLGYRRMPCVNMVLYLRVP